MFNPTPPGPADEAPGSGPKPMSPEGLRAAFAWAVRLLDDDTPEPEVRAKLMAAGLDRKAADSVVQEVLEVEEDKRDKTDWSARAHRLGVFATIRDNARVSIFLGLLILIVGVVITVASFYVAVSSRAGGGTYVLAWGAVLYGGYRVLLGLANVSKNG